VVGDGQFLKIILFLYDVSYKIEAFIWFQQIS